MTLSLQHSSEQFNADLADQQAEVDLTYALMDGTFDVPADTPMGYHRWRMPFSKRPLWYYVSEGISWEGLPVKFATEVADRTSHELDCLVYLL